MKKIRSNTAPRGWRAWGARFVAWVLRAFGQGPPVERIAVPEQPPEFAVAPESGPPVATAETETVRQKALRKFAMHLARLRDMMARRKEQAPELEKPPELKKPRVRRGEWSSDTVSLRNGRIDLAPWVLPARSYRVYRPARLAEDPCIVLMLHGCKQSAEDIAEGTRLNEHADDRGWIIVYPEQTKVANKYGCWNWFDPANGRGDGECALVVAMHEAVRTRFRIRRKRTFLAGMSAGGAMASQLALLFSQQWAGAAVHSGLPFGAASDPWGAQRAMREGAADLAAARELKRATADASPIPALIMHGNEDDVVHRRNADLLVRQFLGWNRYFPDDLEWATLPMPPVTDSALSTATGHAYVLRDYGEGILPPVRECEVVGMGHAWSGGDSAVPFHDEMGPDASALMMEFFSGIAEA